jgi:hypothetical protein
MDTHHLRSIILKLQDRLSDNDRQRLHFFLGNDVPRVIRDNSTLSGTLNLMESLFDQDKISEKDFTFLIYAFHEIRCFDAVKLLKGILRFSIHRKKPLHSKIFSTEYRILNILNEEKKEKEILEK